MWELICKELISGIRYYYYYFKLFIVGKGPRHQFFHWELGRPARTDAGPEYSNAIQLNYKKHIVYGNTYIYGNATTQYYTKITTTNSQFTTGLVNNLAINPCYN